MNLPSGQICQVNGKPRSVLLTPAGLQFGGVAPDRRRFALVHWMLEHDHVTVAGCGIGFVGALAASAYFYTNDVLAAMFGVIAAAFVAVVLVIKFVLPGAGLVVLLGSLFTRRKGRTNLSAGAGPSVVPHTLAFADVVRLHAPRPGFLALETRQHTNYLLRAPRGQGGSFQALADQMSAYCPHAVERRSR